MNPSPHLRSAHSGNHNPACIPDNNFTAGRGLLGLTAVAVSLLVFVPVELAAVDMIPETNGIMRGHRDTVEKWLFFSPP